MLSKAKRWCFTLNNYIDGEVGLLSDILESDHVSYGIYGKETGENGTPHLQGYVIFAQEKRLTQVKALLGARYHLEVSRGTPKEASDYCKKDGNFNEYGTCPASAAKKQGKWEQLVQWCEELTEANEPPPTEKELIKRFPGLMGPQRRGVLKIVASLCRPPTREIGFPRDGWQRELVDSLDVEPDDRSITFIVDPDGNNGKSWICRYIQAKFPTRAQYLRIGKRDDLAHALDTRKNIFLFDIPRTGMEYLQYVVLESLKDTQVFSPKYESGTKEFDPSHVIVFSNEEPDMLKLTPDRYNIIRISERTFTP